MNSLRRFLYRKLLRSRIETLRKLPTSTIAELRTAAGKQLASRRRRFGVLISEPK